MRRTLIHLGLALALVFGFALEASAIEAAFQGKLVLKYKETYEDGQKDKMKIKYDDAIVDTSTGFVVDVVPTVGLGVTYDVKRKNDRKGKVIPADDPETDYTETQDFLNGLGVVGMADVYDLKFKFGFQKINKKFNKNNFELKVKGSYTAMDGPRMGEDVDFTLFLSMPKGKRLAF
jgi:hypothetical protein